MCNLNLVSGFLIAAKAAYLATLIMLGVAMANSTSLFAAAANIPLMILVIASTLLSISMYGAALIEINKCSSGPCGTELSDLRSVITGLMVTLGAFELSLIALAILAPIPFAGAVAIGAFVALFNSLTVLITGGIEWRFTNALNSFNTCRASSGSSTISGAVLAFAYLNILASAVYSVGSGWTEKIPWNIKFEW